MIMISSEKNETMGGSIDNRTHDNDGNDVPTRVIATETATPGATATTRTKTTAISEDSIVAHSDHSNAQGMGTTTTTTTTTTTITARATADEHDTTHTNDDEDDIFHDAVEMELLETKMQASAEDDGHQPQTEEGVPDSNANAKANSNTTTIAVPPNTGTNTGEPSTVRGGSQTALTTTAAAHDKNNNEGKGREGTETDTETDPAEKKDIIRIAEEDEELTQMITGMVAKEKEEEEEKDGAKDSDGEEENEQHVLPDKRNPMQEQYHYDVTFTTRKLGLNLAVMKATGEIVIKTITSNTNSHSNNTQTNTMTTMIRPRDIMTSIGTVQLKSTAPSKKTTTTTKKKKTTTKNNDDNDDESFDVFKSSRSTNTMNSDDEGDGDKDNEEYEYDYEKDDDITKKLNHVKELISSSKRPLTIQFRRDIRRTNTNDNENNGGTMTNDQEREQQQQQQQTPSLSLSQVENRSHDDVHELDTTANNDDDDDDDDDDDEDGDMYYVYDAYFNDQRLGLELEATSTTTGTGTTSSTTGVNVTKIINEDYKNLIHVGDAVLSINDTSLVKNTTIQSMEDVVQIFASYTARPLKIRFRSKKQTAVEKKNKNNNSNNNKKKIRQPSPSSTRTATKTRSSSKKKRKYNDNTENDIQFGDKWYAHLPVMAKNFLHTINTLHSTEEFLTARSGFLVDQFIEYQEEQKQQQPNNAMEKSMKGDPISNARSRISYWKKMVRDRARKDGNTDLAVLKYTGPKTTTAETIPTTPFRHGTSTSLPGSSLKRHKLLPLLPTGFGTETRTQVAAAAAATATALSQPQQDHYFTYDAIFHTEHLGLELGEVRRKDPSFFLGNDVTTFVVKKIKNKEHKKLIHRGDVIVQIGNIQLVNNQYITSMPDVVKIITSLTERPLTVRFERIILNNTNEKKRKAFLRRIKEKGKEEEIEKEMDDVQIDVVFNNRPLGLHLVTAIAGVSKRNLKKKNNNDDDDDEEELNVIIVSESANKEHKNIVHPGDVIISVTVVTDDDDGKDDDGTGNAMIPMKDVKSLTSLVASTDRPLRFRFAGLRRRQRKRRKDNHQDVATTTIGSEINILDKKTKETVSPTLVLSKKYNTCYDKGTKQQQRLHQQFCSVEDGSYIAFNNNYLTWERTNNCKQLRLFTSIFICPVTKDIFLSAPMWIGEEEEDKVSNAFGGDGKGYQSEKSNSENDTNMSSSQSVVKTKDYNTWCKIIDDLYWYPSKKLAENAAAARALDYFLYQENNDNKIKEQSNNKSNCRFSGIKTQLQSMQQEQMEFLPSHIQDIINTYRRGITTSSSRSRKRSADAVRRIEDGIGNTNVTATDTTKQKSGKRSAGAVRQIDDGNGDTNATATDTTKHKSGKRSAGNRDTNPIVTDTTKNKDWSVDDTQRFYLALQLFGTDFKAMKDEYFNKERTQRQLKKKYDTELSINPELVQELASSNDRDDDSKVTRA